MCIRDSPQTNAEKKGSLAMNAMIYKKKGPLVLFLVPTFLFLTMYLYYPCLLYTSRCV